MKKNNERNDIHEFGGKISDYEDNFDGTLFKCCKMYYFFTKNWLYDQAVTFICQNYFRHDDNPYELTINNWSCKNVMVN